MNVLGARLDSILVDSLDSSFPQNTFIVPVLPSSSSRVTSSSTSIFAMSSSVASSSAISVFAACSATTAILFWLLFNSSILFLVSAYILDFN